MRYPEPPEPGTIVGPAYTGEYQVVIDTIDGETMFRPVNELDLRKVAELDSPRSVVEVNLMNMARLMAKGLVSDVRNLPRR